MIASLPMYDWDEVRPATDALWQLVREELSRRAIAAPDGLSRGADLWETWLSPELILGQTCGFPYRTRLHDRVTLVGTPDYGLPGAPPGYYYSVMVMRAEDCAAQAGEWPDTTGKRLVINGFDSQSGWAAPQNEATERGAPFETALVTGAHRESARAVAEGRADIAAIDAVTWRLIRAHWPEVAGCLRVAALTRPTPGLPLITAPGHDADVIFDAFAAAVTRLDEQHRKMLGLKGLVRIAPEAYLAIAVPSELVD